MNGKIFYLGVYKMGRRGVKRWVTTSLWHDEYIHNILTEEHDYKAFTLWQYLLTNPDSHISGTFESPIHIIKSMTGIDEKEINDKLNRFEKDGKIVRAGAWIGIKNFILHQSPTDNNVTGMIKGLMDVPIKIVTAILDNPDVRGVLMKSNRYHELDERFELFKQPATGRVSLGEHAVNNTVVS